MQRLKQDLADLSAAFADFETKWKPIDDKYIYASGIQNVKLHEYQAAGIDWMAKRLAFRAFLASPQQDADDSDSARPHWAASKRLRGLQNDFGAILGDEMGLGKTLQAISLLCVATSRRVLRFSSPPASAPYHPPALIIVPLTVLDNWRSELDNFAPNLNVFVYTGSKDDREDQRRQIKKRLKETRQGSASATPIHVLLTTVDLCTREPDFFQSIAFSTLVVDEAHRLKNRESVLYSILQEVTCCFRLLLTGTPVQNNLNELFSLLRAIVPPFFDEDLGERFVSYFSSVSSDQTRAAELHSILKNFMLRRDKTQVSLELPKKDEIVLHCGLSDLQKKYYKAILKKDVDVFANPSKTRLSNILMQLRKCVNHPYLFDGVEPEPFEMGEHLVNASAKLKMLDQLLPFLKARGHKVLVFSQMTRVLDILQDYLQYRDYNYERLDGSVRGEERFLAVKKFNQTAGGAAGGTGKKKSHMMIVDSDDDDDDGGDDNNNINIGDKSKKAKEANASDESFVFLLSTRAGGLGLNLVAADTVVFFDSDFNPQSDLQAAARAHRIGQTKPVRIIRLVAQHTVEEIILKRASGKLELTHAVIESGKLGGADPNAPSSSSAELTPFDLSEMLKYGVEHLYVPETDEIARMTDKDLTAMLGETTEKHEWCPMPSPSDAAASSSSSSSSLLSSTPPSSSASTPVAHGRSSKDASATRASGSTSASPLHTPSSQPTRSSQDHQTDIGIVPQSMYEFEGLDYSSGAQKKTAAPSATTMASAHAAGFQKLVAEAREEAMSLSDNEGGLDGKRRRVKRQLSLDAEDGAAYAGASSEDAAARKKRRDDAYEARQQQQAQQKLLRQAKALAKKQEMWDERGYVSYNLDGLLARCESTENEGDSVQDMDVSDDGKKPRLLASAPLPILVQALTAKLHAEQRALSSADDQEAQLDGADAKESPSQSLMRWDTLVSQARLEDADKSDTIHLVTGDVTKPQLASSRENAIVVHLVDDSGRWGRGGVFSAIDQLDLVNIPESLQRSVGTVGHWYEVAGEMDDLHLGGVHLIEVRNSNVLSYMSDNDEDDDEDVTGPSGASGASGASVGKGRRWIALVVGYKRDRSNNLKLAETAFIAALESIAAFAKFVNASVHLPRIGHNLAGTDYYSVERIIRSRLSGVQTLIYYFSRHGGKGASRGNKRGEPAKTSGAVTYLGDSDE